MTWLRARGARLSGAALSGVLAAAAAAVAASGCASAVADAPAAPASGPDLLGTSRTLTLPRDGAAYGTAQHAPLPLARGEVVITFDDGPRTPSTPRVLKALADQGVRATFFMNGEPMLREPALARRVRAEGHSVGMHSHRHPHFASMTEAAQFADLAEMDAAWHEVFAGAPAAAYRFPFLEETPPLLAALRARGMTVLSVDAGIDDWLPQQTPRMLADRLMERLQASGGGIVLLHDAQDTTAEALPLLLATLKFHGYRVVHLEWQGQ